MSQSEQDYATGLQASANSTSFMALDRRIRQLVVDAVNTWPSKIDSMGLLKTLDTLAQDVRRLVEAEPRPPIRLPRMSGVWTP
jgi:hypothetical protein